MFFPVGFPLESPTKGSLEKDTAPKLSGFSLTRVEAMAEDAKVEEKDNFDVGPLPRAPESSGHEPPASLIDPGSK